MKMFLCAAVLFLYATVAMAASKKGFPKSTPGAVNIVESVLDFAKSVMEAIELYEELANKYRAKALVKVNNYLDRSLTQCKVIIAKGKTTSDVPISVSAGYEEAFAVQQNAPMKGLDMIFTCRLRSAKQKFLMVTHFSIDQQLAGRKKNELGVSVAADEDNDFDSSFPSGISGSETFTGPLQCAAADFAIQATMITNHQGNITIDIYPKSTKNFSANARKRLNKAPNLQQELDDILDFRQACTSSIVSAGSYIRISTAIMFGAIVGHLLL